jgi:hypothetical protein
MLKEVAVLFKIYLCPFFLLANMLVSTTSVLAQEKKIKSDTNIPVINAPVITEAEISRYHTEKYPVTRWENLNPNNDFYQSPYQISLFSPDNGEDDARLWSQTKSIFAYGLGVIGIIALLPDDVSNWDNEEGIFEKWRTNIKHGPVWDRDKEPLNLIGHPYFGGVYYQVARKSGFRQWDAFVYSALMSTFYWEYGIESFAEVASIQDLIITPVLGWAYGEWAFNTEMDIRQNNNTVWGSSFLGRTALFFLDPVDSLSVGINNLFGKQLIKAGTGYVAVKDVIFGPNGETENQIKLNLSLQLGDGGHYRPTNLKHINRQPDPINTGIIGLSYGIGQVYLDDYWQINNDTLHEYSLGLYFSKTFSSRLSYAKNKVSGLSSTNEVSYENYSLDSQYYFNTQSKFRPYITVGFGDTVWQKDNNFKIFQLNAGVGLHYKLTNNFALQLDWKHYYSNHEFSAENSLVARLLYRLGDGER